MPYTPALNEPKYGDVYVGQLLDKPIYAKGATTGYDAAMKPIYTFKNGDFIGTLFSWYQSGGETYLMFYKSQTDYNNFNPFLVKLNKTTSPAIAEIKAQEAAKADAEKSTLEKYIDKFAPIIVGALVVSILLPTVVNVTTKKTVGAMSKKTKIAGAAAIILLLAFKNRRSKNKVIVSPVYDTTDWSNPDAMTLTSNPKSTSIPKYTILPEDTKPILYSSYDSIMNGYNNERITPYTC